MKPQSIINTPHTTPVMGPLKASDMTFGRYDQGASGFMNVPADSFVRQAAPVKHTGIRFGGCVCPICASIGLIDAAYSKVKDIESGNTVPMGSALSSIAEQTGFDYITHEDGTRLLPPANDDFERVKRVFAHRNVDDSTFPPGVKLDLMADSTLTKWALVGFALREQELETLPAYSQHNPILPLKSDVMPSAPEPGQRYLMSVVHQMFPEKQRDTQPVSLGALLIQQTLPKTNEITVLASREYPSMENMNVAPAGISNVLALQALKQWGEADTVGVFVSPEQLDVHDYMAHLKQLGLPVKRYDSSMQPPAPRDERLAMPDEYQEIDNDAYGLNAVVYQVDVRPLRNWVKTGVPPAVQARLLDRDPAIADKLKLDELSVLNEQQLLTVLRVPPAAGAKVFRSGLEEHGHEDHAHDHDHVHGPGCGCGHSHGPLVQLTGKKPAPQPMVARRPTPTGTAAQPKIKINLTLPLGKGITVQLPESPKKDDPPNS